MIFRRFLLFSIACSLSVIWHHSETSLSCSLRPLPGPEIIHDYYNCSVIVDWRRFITDDCRDDTLGYEVQYITGCSNDTLRQAIVSGETFTLPNKIPGGCSDDTHCYARVRTMFSLRKSDFDEPIPLWSDYSAWTTLSNIFGVFKRCVLKGTDICIPIHANCDGGALPEFIINKQLYLFQEILTNTTHFNVTYNHQEQQYQICFLNVESNVYFLEFCSLHPLCTLFSPSLDGELLIVNRAEIEVHADHCANCSSPETSLMIGVNSSNSSYPSKHHCIVIDFTTIDDINEDKHQRTSYLHKNVCISIVSPEAAHILPSTKIDFRLQGNIIDVNQLEVLNANKTSYCREYNNLTETVEIVLTESDKGSIIYLPRSCANLSVKTSWQNKNRTTRSTDSNSYSVIFITMLSLLCSH